MDIDKLFKQCVKFEKSAQEKIVLDPNKSNTIFWANFLYKAVESYAFMFPTIDFAKKIYNAIAAYNDKPAYNSDATLKQIKSISAALTEASSKLQQNKVDPVMVLRSKGMQNVNPNILNILQSNLKIMENARVSIDLKNAGYQHYQLPRAGQTSQEDVIELDKPEVENGPGY